MYNRLLVWSACLLLLSCNSEPIPKPKAYLKLAYTSPSYQKLAGKRPYQFSVSNQATITNLPNQWLKLQYPSLKASIDITYRPIENNLRELLVESEKLVFKHTAKADQIKATTYSNAEKRVFGSLHEITGNAASQLQFHLTDSTTHFIKGALYFYVKPNYDSVLPAVAYLKKDIVTLMETLVWED